MYMGIKQLLDHRTRLHDVARYAVMSLVAIALLLTFASELRPPNTDHAPTAQIVVHEGDTLWGLALTYGPPHADPRRTVSRILEVNHLNDTLIRPGDVVFVPQS